MTLPRPLPSKNELLQSHRIQIGKLHAEAKTIDLRGFESAPADQLIVRLIPRCAALASAAKAELAALLTVRRGATHISPTSEPPPSQSPYFQVCFVARLEVARQEEELNLVRTFSHSASDLLVRCDTSVRKVKRALLAADAILADALNQVPLDAAEQDLETSLIVRRQYARFLSPRASLRMHGPSDLAQRVRMMEERIAILIDKDAFPLMRLKDRLLVRNLHDRIFNWLEGAHREPQKGKELLSDFETATQMLRLVNHRAELRAYDQARIERALALLGEDAPLETIVNELKDVCGLDPDLDRLLLHQIHIERSDLQQLLTSLQRSLRGASWK